MLVKQVSFVIQLYFSEIPSEYQRKSTGILLICYSSKLRDKNRWYFATLVFQSNLIEIPAKNGWFVANLVFEQNCMKIPDNNSWYFAILVFGFGILAKCHQNTSATIVIVTIYQIRLRVIILE